MNKIERNQYLKSLPKKRIAAGILLFDEMDRLLILKPTYKDHWTIPGGVVEKNEYIITGIERESKEEIGVNITPSKLLLIEHEIVEEKGFRDDKVQFIFYGGVLSGKKMQAISVDREEIAEFKFVSKEQSLKMLGSRMAKRLKAIMKCNNLDKTIFMQNGKVVFI